MIDLSILPKRRIELIRQNEMAECGLACFAMVANHHGLRSDLPTLRRQHGISSRGATFRDLIEIAGSFDMATRPVRLELDELKHLTLPAILHWDMRHFVVIAKTGNRRAFILDPAGTARWIEFDELSKHFTGAALEIVPTPTFQPRDMQQKFSIWQLWSRVEGLVASLGQILLLSLAMQVFLLSLPFYMQFAIDRVTPTGDRELLAAVGLAFGGFATIYALASVLRSFSILGVGTKVGFGIGINVARHLLRLPIRWFEARHAGDVLSRFQSVKPIQLIISETTISSLLDGAFALLTLALMVHYDPLLSAVPVAAVGLYLIVRMLAYHRQKRAEEDSIIASSLEQTHLIETIRNIASLRIHQQESNRHGDWQNKYVEALNAKVRYDRLRILQENAKLFILAIENVVAIWLAITLVIDDRLTIGMVFAFFAYKALFTERTASLIEQVLTFRMLSLHLSRIADIALTEPAVARGARSSSAPPIEELHFRDVRFRYAPGEPEVIRQLSLRIQKGEHLAITGPSGGGKSTLVKLLLGLEQPTTGQYLINDTAFEQFGPANLYSQVSVILQNDALFSGSIRDNISSFAVDFDMASVEEAAALAAIHDDIVGMLMGYDTLVGDLGSTLSGGQIQRVLLARALYRRPKLLIMDEGTAHLDVEHEKRVSRAIGELDVTRIVVAHRHETILAADRVVTLHDGRIE